MCKGKSFSLGGTANAGCLTALSFGALFGLEELVGLLGQAREGVVVDLEGARFIRSLTGAASDRNSVTTANTGPAGIVSNSRRRLRGSGLRCGGPAFACGRWPASALAAGAFGFFSSGLRPRETVSVVPSKVVSLNALEWRAASPPRVRRIARVGEPQA
jgi:hypothetical protein